MQTGEAVSRTAAAVLGGYALAYAFCAGLAGTLAAIGLSKADAVVTATMLSFPLYVAAICYAYGARNARRAWLWIACGIAICGLAVALSRLAL